MQFPLLGKIAQTSANQHCKLNEVGTTCSASATAVFSVDLPPTTEFTPEVSSKTTFEAILVSSMNVFGPEKLAS